MFLSSTPAEYLLVSSVTTCNSFSDAAFTSRFFPVVSSFSVWIAALWKLLQALRVFIFLIVPRHSNVHSSRNIWNKVITKSSREHILEMWFSTILRYTIRRSAEGNPIPQRHAASTSTPSILHQPLLPFHYLPLSKCSLLQVLLCLSNTSSLALRSTVASYHSAFPCAARVTRLPNRRLVTRR